MGSISRKKGRALLVALLICVFFVPFPLLAYKEDPEPYLWVKKVRGDFEEVIADIKAVLASRNFPVTNIRDYKESFGRRFEQLGKGRLPFKEYRIVEFCNVMLAIRALQTELRMGIFLPCRLVVYAPLDSDEITVIAVNPHFMPVVTDNPELKPVVREIAAVVKEVFESLEFH